MTSGFHFSEVLLMSFLRILLVSHSQDEVAVWDVVIALPSIKLESTDSSYQLLALKDSLFL